jgi:hypothetical protein
MIGLLVIGTYALGAIGFYLFDALIGWGVELDGYNNPPVSFVAFFWMIAVPCLIVVSIFRWINRLKVSRLEKQKQKKQLRVAAEKELKQIESQIEEELAFNEVFKSQGMSK